MNHSQFIEHIEQFAPLNYQETYDNAGWQIGKPKDTTSGILLCLDVTETVIQEAIEKKYNLIISHHPVIFPHVKKITDTHHIGRTILTAIENKISIYTAHTNIDNVKNGVNAKFAEKLGLKQTEILSTLSNDLYKYIVYSPSEHAEKVKNAIFSIGAGVISDYSECSFSMQGIGTFKPSENANPTIGTAGGNREEVEEMRIEVITQKHFLSQIISKVKEAHPYEEVAYDIIPLANKNQAAGAGMVGYLEEEMNVDDFLQHIRNSMNVGAIKYTHAAKNKIKKVGICGGSGSFLLSSAIAQRCDAFITSDIKYHQFFDAEDKICLIDIGHYETEQYTPEIFYDILKNKFPNFAICISKINTNPINYF